MSGVLSSAAGAAAKGAVKPTNSNTNKTDPLSNALGGLLKPH
jgi:hypothetical protein